MRLWLRATGSISDKAVRARSIQTRASMGKVWSAKHANLEAVFSSLMRFLAGKIDDPVDTLSLVHRGRLASQELRNSGQKVDMEFMIIATY